MRRLYKSLQIDRKAFCWGDMDLYLPQDQSNQAKEKSSLHQDQLGASDLTSDLSGSGAVLQRSDRAGQVFVSAVGDCSLSLYSRLSAPEHFS